MSHPGDFSPRHVTFPKKEILFPNKNGNHVVQVSKKGNLLRRSLILARIMS